MGDWNYLAGTMMKKVKGKKGLRNSIGCNTSTKHMIL